MNVSLSGLELAVGGMMVGLLSALPVGILSAVGRDRVRDQLSRCAGARERSTAVSEGRIASPHLGHLYPLLLETGVCADVEGIWVSSNYVYETKEDLVDRWSYHLPVDGDLRKARRSALLPSSARRGEASGDAIAAESRC